MHQKNDNGSGSHGDEKHSNRVQASFFRILKLEAALEFRLYFAFCIMCKIHSASKNIENIKVLFVEAVR